MKVMNSRCLKCLNVAQRGLSSEWEGSCLGHILQQLQATLGPLLEWCSVGPGQPHTVLPE